MGGGILNFTEYVGACPFCAEHPPYLPTALQCVACALWRPLRTSTVKWNNCPFDERGRAQAALDLIFHSASPTAGDAFIDVEWNALGIYFLKEARVTRRGTGLALPQPASRVIEAFAAAGLLATK